MAVMFAQTASAQSHSVLNSPRSTFGPQSVTQPAVGSDGKPLFSQIDDNGEFVPFETDRPVVSNDEHVVHAIQHDDGSSLAGTTNGENPIQQVGHQTFGRQTHRGRTEPFFADRPRQLPRVSTVPNGTAMAEIGGSYSSLTDDYLSWEEFDVEPATANILLRFGIADAPVELRLFSELGRESFHLHTPSGFSSQRDNFAGSIGGGLKWNFLEQSMLIPEQAVVAEIGFGDDDIASETIWRLEWLAHWAIGESFYFDMGLGGGNLTVFDDLESGAIVSLLVGRRFGDKLDTFFEVFTTGGDNIVQIGLAYRLSENAQIDIAGGSRAIIAKEFWFDGSDGEFTGGYITAGLSFYFR